MIKLNFVLINEIIINKWNSSVIENTVLTFNFPYLIQILKIYRPWKPISNYNCQIKTFALLLQKNINSKLPSSNFQRIKIKTQVHKWQKL